MDFRIGDTKVQWRLPVRGCPIQVTCDTQGSIAYIDLKRIPKNQFQNILSPHTLAEVIASLKAGYPTVIVDYGITQSKLAKELLSEDSQRLIWERTGISPKELKIIRIDLEKPKGIDTTVVFHRVEQQFNDFSLPSKVTSSSNYNGLCVNNSGTIPRTNNSNIIENDARTQLFREYPGANSSDSLTISSSTIDFNFSKDEILLEGYGPWNDEFEKAMSLIDQGNQVILKKEDPSGIERPVTIKLKQGENNKELVVDLTNLGIIECSDVLPKLLNYLLNQDGKSIILNCGLVGPDDLVEEVEEYILSDLPCGTAYELIYREIPKGYMHPVLIFK